MKVLIVNGSPKTSGGTHISCEIARGVLNKNGIETEIVNLGKGTVNDCIGCGACENLCPARPFSAIYVEGNEVHHTN